jgi:hypothetical protein
VIIAVLRIRDVYPGSCFLSIPDPGSNNSTKRDRGKCFLSYHKKFFFAKTLRMIVLFTQKFVIKLSKIWVRDPGYGHYSGSGVKEAPDPGSWIPDPDPQHQIVECWNVKTVVTRMVDGFELSSFKKRVIDGFLTSDF